MTFKVKGLLVLGLAGLVFIGGRRAYNYFCDTQSPCVRLAGLEEQGFYAGDIQCNIACDKVGVVSTWLDDKPLVKDFDIAQKDSEQAFTIPSCQLANGEHTLRYEFVDKTYNSNKAIGSRTFVVDNVPLQAAFVSSDRNKVFQGRTLHVQFQVNKPIKKATVKALSQEYVCIPESKNSLIYEAFVPIAVDESPNEYILSVLIEDKVGSRVHLDNKFQVVGFPFKKQKLYVSAAKIEKEKELADDDSSDLEELLASYAHNSPHEKLWRGRFCTPIDVVRTSCDFGVIRTTQEKGKYRHNAVDILNAPKSVVWACAAGNVVLAKRFANSGNTVVIDHGMGILSMYFHLAEIADIIEGQKVAQGNRIGTLGKTGYATGYHLHWEIRVNNVQVDPMQWTMRTF